MKKIWIAMIISLLFLAIVLVLFYIKGLYPLKFYETNWNIDIPDSAIEEYSTETAPSFHGEGTKFSVLTVDGEDAFFNDFSVDKSENFENNVKKTLEQIDFDESYYPDFSKDYIWCVKTVIDDSLYMLFDEESEKLFVIADVW